MEKVVYTVKDIQEMLMLSTSTAYSLVRLAYETGTPFRVIKAGHHYRIPVKGFDEWINK